MKLVIVKKFSKFLLVQNKWVFQIQIDYIIKYLKFFFLLKN